MQKTGWGGQTAASEGVVREGFPKKVTAHQTETII